MDSTCFREPRRFISFSPWNERRGSRERDLDLIAHPYIREIVRERREFNARVLIRAGGNPPRPLAGTETSAECLDAFGFPSPPLPRDPLQSALDDERSGGAFPRRLPEPFSFSFFFSLLHLFLSLEYQWFCEAFLANLAFLFALQIFPSPPSVDDGSPRSFPAPARR